MLCDIINFCFLSILLLPIYRTQKGNIMLFTELGLSDETVKAVADMGFEEATEIQAKTIPLILAGKDVIGRSHTGTGKTAAFGIPAVEMTDRSLRGKTRTLILCPTRELALQVCEEIKKFSAFMPWIHTCAIYGGADIEKQIVQLKRGAEIVVGTPGRVMDHISRNTLKLENIRMVVLDEADEMLNMGFREDIETILGFVPDERQTVLFSATMPEQIMALTERYQRSPVIVGTEQRSRTVESVEQFYFSVPMGRKTDALQMLLLAYEPKLSMVFCNTKRMVDELSEQLVSKGFRAAGLHGDMKQSGRNQVLDAFKSGRINILIATDVAARGIDVDNVDAVFNYDIPQDIEYYIHRIGRTGRAGKTGKAYTIVSGRKQIAALNEISKYTKARIERREIPSGDEVSAAKISALNEKIKNLADSGKYDRFTENISELAAQGYPAEKIAAVLLGMKIAEETKNIPEFSSAAHKDQRSPEKRSGTAKIEISVGRRNKIAPNFILGALAETTGLPGKSFGKIDIYDSFTTVEVPEDEKEFIIGSMTGTKINGSKIKIGLYKGKTFDNGRGERHRNEKSFNDRGRNVKKIRNSRGYHRGSHGGTEKRHH